MPSCLWGALPSEWGPRGLGDPEPAKPLRTDPGLPLNDCMTRGRGKVSSQPPFTSPGRAWKAKGEIKPFKISQAELIITARRAGCPAGNVDAGRAAPSVGGPWPRGANPRQVSPVEISQSCAWEQRPRHSGPRETSVCQVSKETREFRNRGPGHHEKPAGKSRRHSAREAPS